MRFHIAIMFILKAIKFRFVGILNSLRSAVNSESDSRDRWPWFDTRSDYILSFLLPFIQDGQLSVTGEVLVNRFGGLRCG